MKKKMTEENKKQFHQLLDDVIALSERKNYSLKVSVSRNIIKTDNYEAGIPEHRPGIDKLITIVIGPDLIIDDLHPYLELAHQEMTTY